MSEDSSQVPHGFDGLDHFVTLLPEEAEAAKKAKAAAERASAAAAAALAAAEAVAAAEAIADEAAAAEAVAAVTAAWAAEAAAAEAKRAAESAAETTRTKGPAGQKVVKEGGQSSGAGGKLIVGGMIAFSLVVLAIKPDTVGYNAPAQIQERSAPPSSAPADPSQSNYRQSGPQPSGAPAGEPTPGLLPDTPINGAPARDLYSDTPANPMSRFTDVPPAGVGLLLSTGQIAWCLAEEISIEAVRPYINPNAQIDVVRINSRIASYDSRCARTRYRSDDLAKARRIVEARRSQLEYWARRGQ